MTCPQVGNDMEAIPEAIEILIKRCEVNEVYFDNDDMSTALTYARVLRLENEELKASIRGLWLHSMSHHERSDVFAKACGVTRERLFQLLATNSAAKPLDTESSGKGE